MNYHSDFDFSIYIGRFRPLHNGHIKNIEKALEISKHLIILVGSANNKITFKNPWNDLEVIEMIYSIFPYNLYKEKITVFSIKDFQDDNNWVINVKNIINLIILNKNQVVNKSKITLIGYNKDDSSYYLKLFPEWSFSDMPNVNKINGTDIRRNFFLESKFLPFALPLEIEAYLNRWRIYNPELFNKIKESFPK